MRRRLCIVVAIVAVALIVTAIVVSARLRRARLLADLHDPSPAVRTAAIRSWDGSTDIDLFLPALNDGDADVRLLTAMRLGERTYREREPVPNAAQRAAALLEALRDRHAGVRRAAGESLWALGPASTPGLIEALKDPDPRVRTEAARALQSWQGKEDRVRAAGEVQAIKPLLKALLDDDDAEVRRSAKETLRQLR